MPTRIDEECEQLKMEFVGVFKLTEEKLGKYYAPEKYECRGRGGSFTQPALNMLSKVRAFVPHKAAYLSIEARELEKAFAGFNEQESLEYEQYLSQCSEVKGEIHPIKYWLSSAGERYPHLAKIALRYLSVPSSSADAERSFSARGDILTCRRRNLTRENRARLTFLYANRQLEN